jgi:hypothetical protein
MNLKLGYFIPPIVLIGFAAAAFMFGGTMYKNYQVDQVLKSKDRKYVCLTNTYDIKRDEKRRFYVDFGEGLKFYFHNFQAQNNASDVVLVTDSYNRVTWAAVSQQKARYIKDVYGVPQPGCRIPKM